MGNVKRSLLLVTALSVLLLVPLVAQTYTLLQPTRHWRSTPVQICVNSPGHVSITANDTDQGITATIEALNGTHSRLAATGWNTVPSVGTVVNASACNTPWRLGDGVPTIAFTEMISGTCSGSCLAATFTGYYHCNDPFHPDGHCLIDDADVETRRNRTDKAGGPYYSLYESGCKVAKEWNIEGIMVHEVGHVLGLGHSNVSGATMYPSVSSCQPAPATIAADDASALDALY